MLSKTHHETIDGLIFGSKIPRQGPRFRMWAGNSPLRLASTHLFGESGKPRISSKTKLVKRFPNIVHGKLLGHDLAGNVSRRLDTLEWTVAYMRSTLSYWIIRHGGAANLTCTPLSPCATLLVMFLHQPCTDGLWYPNYWELQRYLLFSNVACKT